MIEREGALGFGLFLPVRTGLTDQRIRVSRGDRREAHLTQQAPSQGASLLLYCIPYKYIIS